MKLSHRTLVVLAAALLLLLALGLDSARPAEDKEKEKAAGSLRLATDDHAAMQLQAAADYIQDEDWKSALRLLQHLLDGKPNTLARLAGREGKAERTVSMHTEAERLLASLPEAGRKAYQQAYGPRAADLLEVARTVADEELFARVVQRYLYTDAGPAALRELARWHYKKGRLTLAALAYARLLEHLGPARWTNDDLYQAAVAFHHCGTSALTDQMLKQLLARTEQNIVRLGKRRLTVEVLRKEIERAAPSRQALVWPLYRGDPARMNRGAGDPPLLEAMWRQSMLYGKDSSASAARERIRKATNTLKTQNQPIISAFSPIALTALAHKGEKQPLLIYRNFFGVMAADLRNGSLAWASPSSWSLQRIHGSTGSKQTVMGQWLNYYQGQHPQILFENSTAGTLSSDGQYVYVVEDLAIPPMPRANVNNMRFPGGMPHQPDLDKDLEDAVSHNRLFALSLARSGALTWALGDDEKDPLRDHYFLGPPLPLAGKLYVLTEKQQEIRLICLEPTTPDPATQIPKPTILSTQTLCRTQEKLDNDPLRRTWAAHLAYGEGILVCPTNTGAVFGVSLLENSLIWAYPYRDKSDAAEQPEMGNRRFRRQWPPSGFQIGPDGQLHPTLNKQNQWKVTAPIISDGKVVFAAPDARSVHCINLRDGSLIWKRPKFDDDLYLGNVFKGKVLIVGKKNVRALSLSSGETLWTLETGMPSGQGIAASDLYYLPLQRGSLSKQPEILVLDINKGRVIAHNKTQPRTPRGTDFEVPGNLVFIEGKLISQSPWEVVAYPPLKAKLKEADEGVEKHSGDPARLIERAVLRLHNGEPQGAIVDLRAALSKKLDKETQQRVRALLFEALSDWFARDLRAAEASLKEYKELTAVDLEGLTGKKLEEGRAEQRRRQWSYFLLAARLRESQGRLAETLQTYLDFSDAAPSEEMLPLPDEPAVKVRLDVWIRSRIAELVKKATAEQRQKMEEVLGRLLKRVRDRKDEHLLRGFLELVGPETTAGCEGRLLLAERVLGRLAVSQFLEAELYLLQVRDQGHDRIRAARAVEMLGRLMTAQGLMPDAVYFYRLLHRDFAKIVLPDGKTGADVWDALATDKRLLPYLDETQFFNSQKYKASKKSGDFRGQFEVFPFEHVGEELPFFRRHLAGLEIDCNKFYLQNRTNGKTVWTANLTPTSFRTLLPNGRAKRLPKGRAKIWPRFWYHTRGHLIVMPIDNLIFGIDPMGRRILWQKDTLAGIDRSRPSVVPVEFDPVDSSARLRYPDGWVRFPGNNLALSPSVLCLVTRTGLQGCDPLTGRLLWTRADITSGVRLFVDEEHVFAVEEDAKGNAVSTHVLRLADGSSLRVPDFATLFAQRVQTHGRTLVLSPKTDKGAVSLRLYDIPTGAVTWERTFAPKSLVMRSEEQRFAGVVEPNGKVHIVDVAARKEVMTGQIAEPAEHLRKVETIHLLAGDSNFYLACFAPVDGEGGEPLEEEGSHWSDLGLGRRGLPVNGMLYAFSRTGGEALWYNQVKNQRLVLEQFRDSPLFFFTSSKQVLNPLGAAEEFRPFASVLCIQKRDGRVIYIDTIKGGKPFYAMRVDPQTGTVEYLSPNRKIVCQPQQSGNRK